MNPEKAVDAILEGGEKRTTAGIVVRPLTLARYAYLEKVKSPLLTGEPDVDATLMTAYVMTCPTEKLKTMTTREEIWENAVEWADENELSVVPEIIDQLKRALSRTGAVSPAQGQADDGKKKRLPTDG